MTTTHTWNFFRAGGFDQVQIDNGADLLALKELDQKLWVALSCPTRGIEFDTRTLDLIDNDKDAHVHANEVLGAIAWAGGLLKNPDLLVAVRTGWRWRTSMTVMTRQGCAGLGAVHPEKPRQTCRDRNFPGRHGRRR